MKSVVHPLIAVTVCALILGAPGCSRQASKAQHIAEGDRYFVASQYDHAEIEYLNVLSEDAVNAHAITRLGEMYAEQGRFGRAFPLLLKGRELQPDDLHLRQKLALYYLITGNRAEARKEAIFILERNSQDTEAPIILAETAVRPEEIESARQVLERLPSPAAEGASMMVALGTLDARQGRFDAAETWFKKAQARDPQSAAVYASLGTLYRTRRDLPHAEEAFKKAAELSPPRSPRLLLYPKFKVQNGDINGGKAALADIIKKSPDYLPPQLMLAEIAAAEKKHDDALELVAKVLARDSINPEALLLSSRLLLAKGEADRAITELERMLKIYPQSPQVYYQLGMAYVVRKDSDKASSSLSNAIALAPGFSEAILLLAEIDLRRGRYISAIAALKPVVQQHPEIAQARLMLADAYRRQGDLDAALAEYRKIEELFPRTPQIYLLRGAVLIQQNKRDAAREAFAKALELAPDFLPALEQLVDLELLEKNPAAAARRLDPLIDANPKQAGLYLLRAKICTAQQDPDRAEAALRKVIELQPDSLVAYLMLARLYMVSHQLDKALVNFQAVSARDPKNVESLMLIGLIFDQQKNYVTARDAYEKLLAVNPNFLPALNNLACLYSDRFDRLDRAYELAQRARELAPLEPHITDTLGWILYKQRAFPRALGLLRDSAFNLPDSATVLFHAGMAAYVMGEETAAAANLSRALELDKDLLEAGEARRCLAVLAIDPAKAGPAELASLEKILKDQPDDPVVLVRLSILYQQADDPNKAFAAGEAAYKSNPNSIDVLMRMIRLQIARNDTTKAVELAKAARRLAPQDPDVAYALGRLAVQIGDHRWAANLLQEAASRKTDDPDVLYDFAEAAYRVGQISEAEDAAKGALKAGGAFLRADKAKLLAELSALSGNPAQALAAAPRVEQVLRADPDYVPAMFVSALIDEQKSTPEAARLSYEKILGRCPDFAPAKKRLAVLAAKKTGEKK